MNTEVKTQGLPMQAAETPFVSDINKTPVVVAPPNWHVHQLKDCMLLPRRVDTCISMADLQSFIEYVNRHKEASTIIKLFARKGSEVEARAIIDFHAAPDEEEASKVADDPYSERDYTENEARWCEHVAEFSTRATSSWLAWSSQNGTLLSQSKFADFIYQNMPEIMEPKGADLLEMVATLKALSKGVFKNQKDLHTGSMDQVAHVEVTLRVGNADKPFTLPKQFKIAVQVFYGGPVIELVADLLVRVPSGDEAPVSLGYRFYRLDDVLESMMQDVNKQLVDETKVPVYRCK